MTMFLETADIETASADYAARFNGAAGEYFLARQAEITLGLLSHLPQARVLDVGGGHAQLAEPLVKNGYAVTVTGSDDSCRKRLDQCLVRGSFTYLTCDSLSLPFEDRSFDVVMAFRLLPHVTRWRQIIAELCRVADKCVIVDYPDRRSTNIFYEQLFGMKKKLEGNTRPFTLFSRSEIAASVAGNNFAPPLFVPEFLLPMVVHRKVGNKALSTAVEACCRLTGLTQLFGSPIIFRSDRLRS
ncbi:MAG: class I SAM-dependent methyltransferase [Proteobacteria bacterium]|nr:class I SAM-dependent methyltransferase [Pseudomonadota bacterium]